LCHALLGEARLYEALLRFDEDLAATARTQGCRCGGVLHSARFPRKPRGAAIALGPQYDRRLSFCCAREGCRARTTPASLRFLGRRAYLGAVVVLVAALHQGLTGRRARRLRELVGVSLRTLKRWRRWWREELTASAFWKARRGLFAAPVEAARLPASLLERFAASNERERLVAALAFLAPITTTSSRVGSTMAI